MADATPRTTASSPVLVLASASPRRAELLARLQLTPVVRPTDLDEQPRPGERPRDLVLRLATAKAATGAELGSGDEVVLAADTVVVLGERILTKPRDRDEASEMLHSLAGRTHDVITGVAVRRGQRTRRTAVTTRVRFRVLTATEIAWYVATGEPDDKAGAYGLQGAGAVLVEHIEGSDTNVIGLPLTATVALLREMGLDPLQPGTAARPDRPSSRASSRPAQRHTTDDEPDVEGRP